MVFARTPDDRLASLAGALNGLVEQQKAANLKGWVTIVDDPAKEELKKQLTRIAEARKTAIPLTIVKDDDKIAPLKLRKDTPVVVIAYSKVKVVDKMVFDAEQWKSLSDEKIKEMIARFKKALIGTS